MIVSIIGAGAVGKFYGGLLALSGAKVHFLLRSEFLQIQKQGYYKLNLRKSENKLKVVVEPSQLYQKPEDLPKSDLIIISVKTTENAQLGKLIQKALKPNTIVLIIQNGLGNEEHIAKYCPTQPIITGVSNIAATREKNALVEVHEIGELRLAPFKQKDQVVCDKIYSLFHPPISVPIKIYDDYKAIKWHKLLWNVPFSSLSVLFDKSVDLLAMTPHFAAVVKGLMREVRQIALSESVSITEEYARASFERTKTWDQYFPSMYWDLKNHRPIEKEYIVDNVLAKALENGIETPLLTLTENSLKLMLFGAN